MINKNEYFVFDRYDKYGKEPDIFISPHHNYEDAVFEFIFVTLGYKISKVTSKSPISVEQVWYW